VKKKTVYIWMVAIAGLTTILFAAIYFLNLGQKVNNRVTDITEGEQPSFSYFIQGDFESPLEKPMDVSKIGEFIYVTDTNHKQVQVFDSSGTPIFQFGEEGDGEGQFTFPYGITGDKDGNVYVADLFNGKISIFNEKGKFLRYFEEKDSSSNSISGPAGMRIVDNKLYMTDIKESKIMVFTLDGKKELEVSTVSSKDDSFNAPNAIAVDLDKNLYISDSGNQRVVVLDSKGNFKRIINGSKDGKGDSKFINPRGLAVDSQGTLFMVDNMTHFVYGFDEKGENIFQFGGMGSENEQFYLPNGLFIDEKRQLYVTDTFNQRIAIYY
jgi:DNA-binding beta-propeller fold protein YncE